MAYADLHSRALETVARKGAAVVFTAVGGGTVTGHAIQDAPNLKQYEALGLVLSDARTLFFVPSTYGNLPSQSSTVSWGGASYYVSTSDPLAPDGTVIGATVVISK